MIQIINASQSQHKVIVALTCYETFISSQQVHSDYEHELWPLVFSKSTA